MALEQEVADLQHIARELQANYKQKTLDLRNLQQDNQNLKKLEKKLTNQIDHIGKVYLNQEDELEFKDQ